MLPLVFLLVGCGPHGKNLRDLMISAEKKGFSGSVLVVHHGDVLHDEGYGEAVRGSEPFTPETVSSIGSLTKQFTAAGLLRAEEEGFVVSGDKVNKYVDTRNDFVDITLHQVMSHQSGLVDSIGADEDKIGKEKWLKQVWETDLDFKPGEGFGYSNVGFGVAAAVLEDVTGMDYEAWLRQELFLPAGMFHTGYDDPDWSDSVVAEGYHKKDEYGDALGLDMGPDDYWHVVGNGELLSTTEDMHSWLKALTGGTVLSQESVDLLFSVHSENGKAGYGYGWGIEETDFGTAIEHDGSNGFYFSHLIWWPDQELFVFYLSNDRRAWTPDFAWDISTAVLDPK